MGETLAMISEPRADARDMFALHTMFRREFGLMSGLVRGVNADDKRRMTIVADHVALLGQALLLHHTGEDRHVWPLLLERGTDQIASIIGAMVDEHNAVHQRLLQLNDTLESWRESASTQTRDSVAGDIEQLVPVLAAHLAKEEQRVVPLIEKYLTAEEYGLLAEEAVVYTPPDKLPTIFGMVMYETSPTVIDMIVRQMPAEVQPVIRGLAVKAYAAHAQEVYGTATPPRFIS
jgi:hemerythrin-like domain-containing protein